MIQAKKLVCSICGQEQNLTQDGEVECLKCGYIKKITQEIVIKIIRRDDDSGQADDEIETYIGALKVFTDVQNKHNVYATFEVE